MMSIMEAICRIEYRQQQKKQNRFSWKLSIFVSLSFYEPKQNFFKAFRYAGRAMVQKAMTADKIEPQTSENWLLTVHLLYEGILRLEHKCTFCSPMNYHFLRLFQLKFNYNICTYQDFHDLAIQNTIQKQSALLISFLLLLFIMNLMSLREPSLTQEIKDIAFNVRFWLLKYFEEYQTNSLLKQGDEIHILGHSFIVKKNQITQIADQIYKIFLATPWFTYRSGFPELPNQLNGSYVSDTGWGCMIRVGQMLFAQIIKEHRELLSGQQTDTTMLLNLFNDFDKKSPLSIQNISKLALIYYNLLPGQWYNPSQIANVLSALFQKNCSKKQKLNFIVFNNGSIFFDQILQKMFNSKPPSKTQCTCIKQKGSVICEKCFEKHEYYSLGIIVMSRIGIDKPQQKYLSVLQDFMTMKQFRGILGGKPKKALYFLGRHNKDYIYLDPHYVQKAKMEIEEISESYVCESFRKCANTAIDASLGICFYIKDLKSLNSFYDGIKRIKERDSDNMFVFASDTTPYYMKKERSEQFQLDSDDQNFQEL